MTRDRSGRCRRPRSGRSARTAHRRSAAGWRAAGLPPARSRPSRRRGSSCRRSPVTRAWRYSPTTARPARTRAATRHRCSPDRRTRSRPRRRCGTSARTCTARSPSGWTAPAQAAHCRPRPGHPARAAGQGARPIRCRAGRSPRRERPRRADPPRTPAGRRDRRTVRPPPHPRRSLGGVAALPHLGRRPPACAARAGWQRNTRRSSRPTS